METVVNFKKCLKRFKVVKIESTEPFKRGRWTCMDYLDHTSVNQPTAISTPKVSDPNEVCISYGVTDSGIVVPDSTKQSIVSDDKQQSLVDANGQVSHQEVHSQQINVPNNANFVGNSIGQPVQSATQSQYFPPSTQQQQQQQPAHPSSLGQSMPQGSIPLMTQANSSNVPAQQSMVHSKEADNNAYVGSQSQPLQPAQTSSPASQANILVTQQQPQQQQKSQQQITQISEPMGSMQGMQGMQSIHKVPQSGVQQTPIQSQVIPGAQIQAQQATGNAAQVQMTQVAAAGCQNVLGGMQQQQQQGSMTFHKPDTEQDSISGIVVGSAQQSADAALLESLAEVTQANDENNALEDNESMSGTSAVAIDNKIEQAMDLVKSHLMFAVREEVEVLKEKIAELMDRINQLEAENAILKAHATPETLAQLSQATAKLPINNSGSGQ